MSDKSQVDSSVTFADLGLPDNMLATLEIRGYKNPSPIQAQTIPPLLTGRDVLGMAQTGTGKTAAFSLPLLAQVDASLPETQMLVLAPTRELAIQVAESCSAYGKSINGLRVSCLYGGSSYVPQLQQLKRGAHVVVGTPGRLIDHLNRGTLRLDNLKALVLDEADEMLRMGFIDDVTKIAEACPEDRQTALFSATMPPAIAKLAHKQTRDPVEIRIKADHSKAALIRQRAAIIPYRDKIDALLRLLAVEETDGVIVFVATKSSTNEVAEALNAQGHRAAMLSGDVAQRDREFTVNRFIKGQIDVLVATDVAARGLDVDRVSHVVNFDLPPDVETYTHRIGRTGRAGRSGEAIAFANPNQRYILNNIIRRTGNDIDRWEKPSAKEVNAIRLKRFGARLVLEHERRTGLEDYQELIGALESEHGIPAAELAATLARMVNGDSQAFRDNRSQIDRRPAAKKAHSDRGHKAKTARHQDRPPRKERFRDREQNREQRPPRDNFDDKPIRAHKGKGNKGPVAGDDGERSLYTIDIGHRHGATPARILAAIANASGLSGGSIGRIAIGHSETVIEMPKHLSTPAIKALAKTRINGHALGLDRQEDF